MPLAPADGYVRLEGGVVPATSWVTTEDGPVPASIGVTVPEGGGPGPVVHTIASMLATEPFYVSHRLGGRNYPEFSMRGADASVAHGYKALELSVHACSTGEFVLSHDWITTRMTGEAHVIATTPWSTLSTLTSTAADTTDPAQSRTPLIRLSDIIEKYGQSHVLFIDHKETSGGDSSTAKLAQETRLLDYLETIPGSKSRFVWKVFAAATASRARAAARGFKSWGIYYPPDMASLAGNASQFDILGMEYNAAQAHWDTLKSTGRPVMAHIVGTVAQVNAGTLRGADGFMCSAPATLGP